eukprot:evm.model.scf_673.1 EVM.evm.TU.scf_673.1   scf_673:29780-34114(+)
MESLLGRGDGGPKGRGQEAWLKACQWSCALQISGGLVMIVCSTMYLFEMSRVSGQIIGLVLMAVGSVGMYGSFKASREAFNVHLMGVILAMMLAFQFVGEVSREVNVDCAIAEIYVRGKVTEKIVRKQQEATMFNTIYSRLDEMEDLMTTSEKSVVKAWEHRQEQAKLRDMDMELLLGKVAKLHEHAETLLAATEGDALKGVSKDQMKIIRDTAWKIQKVLASDEDIDISFDDYKNMLHDLREAFQHMPFFNNTAAESSHDEIHKAIEELGSIGDVFDRVEENSYDSLHIGATGQQLAEMEQARDERRQKWAEEFEAALAQHQRAGATETELEDFPEHCMKESTGNGAIEFAGIVILLSQFASGYCALTTLLKLPIKVD